MILAIRDDVDLRNLLAQSTQENADWDMVDAVPKGKGKAKVPP